MSFHSDSGFDRIPLDIFLGDPDTRGVVFLRGQSPILEVHLFADSFSLFWPSQPERLKPDTVVDTLALAIDSLARSDESVSEALISVLIPGPSRLNEDQTRVKLERGVAAPRDALSTFFVPRWQTSVSVFAAVRRFTEPMQVFAVWTDTPSTPLETRETGGSAAYGTVPVATFSQLISSTVAFDGQLASNEVERLLAAVSEFTEPREIA
jgi:hypothetical protein